MTDTGIPVLVRRPGRVDYTRTWHAMQDFNAARGPDTADEIWLLQHPPVYTVGLNARAKGHPDFIRGIPVISCDRGGEITYHGPGQWVAYCLLDIRRRRWGVKHLVRAMEQAVLDTLQTYGIDGHRIDGAPGVYVQQRKIASLGLRIRGGGSYHGVSFNVDMDLAPFAAIAPCGYDGLEMTQLRELTRGADPEIAGERLLQSLLQNLGYNEARPGKNHPPQEMHHG